MKVISTLIGIQVFVFDIFNNLRSLLVHAPIAETVKIIYSFSSAIYLCIIPV